MATICIAVYLYNERNKLFYCMRKILTAYIFFFFLLHAAKAQQHLVDSITNELQQSMPDSNRAISMMRLAIDYEGVDTAKAYKAYRDAIKFAAEKKLYYNLGRIYQNQSFLFSAATNYTQTKTSLDTAVMYYQKSDHPNAKLWEANAYGDIANVLKLQNDPAGIRTIPFKVYCII